MGADVAVGVSRGFVACLLFGIVGCRPGASATEGIVGTAESRAASDAPLRAAGAPGVAVGELFTSEGCSSCPPADAVLARVDAERAGEGVFLLAFHVDYWNELGWPDPFSAEAFTDRQRAYARRFGEHGVYTPELVVGGTEGFVGSDEARARGAIDAELARPARARVELHTEADAGRVRVAFSIAGSPPGATLAVALVDRERQVDVPRGENAGRHLVHVNVVRAFRVVPAESKGAVDLDPPPDRDGPEAVVAYVQERETLAVLGAARAELP